MASTAPDRPPSSPPPPAGGGGRTTLPLPAKLAAPPWVAPPLLPWRASRTRGISASMSWLVTLLKPVWFRNPSGFCWNASWVSSSEKIPMRVSRRDIALVCSCVRATRLSSDRLCQQGKGRSGDVHRGSPPAPGPLRRGSGLTPAIPPPYPPQADLPDVTRLSAGDVWQIARSG